MTHASPAGPDGAPHQAWAVTAEKINGALRGVLMAVDLVVTSQARFDERSQIPGTLEYAAYREGRVLHDSL